MDGRERRLHVVGKTRDASEGHQFGSSLSLTIRAASAGSARRVELL